MSLDNSTEMTEKKSDKKGFSLEKYFQQLQQLDVNNIGAWPTSVKVTIYILILAVIGLVTYFVFVRDLQDQIRNAEAQEQNLLNEYKEKDSKLRHLQSYQEQIRLMEAQFNQQLEQLPKESEIPGLVEDINAAGVSAGLEFKNITLQPEVKQEIFIEQPIDINVTGNYHSIGGFASSIAGLSRIVTLHDFKVTAAENSKNSEVPQLAMNIKAKTYRYSGKPAEKKPEQNNEEAKQ